MIISMFEDIKAIINSHFGRNPVNGGSPPNDRSSRTKMLLAATDSEVIFII